MKIKITSVNKNERLDLFLMSQLPKISRNQIQKLIKAGLVLVNGKKVLPHHWLKENELVEIETESTKQQAPSTKLKANKKIKLTIIFENADYAVINKPAGLMVHPTDKMEQDTLVNGLIAHFPKIKKVGDDLLRPGIVHRLDKEVSGLMIIAKTQKAFTYFKSLFTEHKIVKTYTALVHQQMEKDHEILKTKISRSKTEARMASRPMSQEGKEAITEYWVEKNFNNFSLLKIQIHTGRTHQIRAVLFSLNHPVVGDTLYKQRNVKEKMELDRLFLHATQLEFNDPKGQTQKFIAPLPTQLKQILKELK